MAKKEIFKELITAKKGSEAIQEFKKLSKDKFIFVSLGRVKTLKSGVKQFPVKYRQRA